MPGAALLAGIGGLRAGAGKLQIATAASVAPQLAIAVPEARVVGFEETEEGCLAPSDIGALLDLAEGADAVTIGCGLQHGPPLDAMLDALLASGCDTPLVLDAAVLGSLPPRAEALRSWRGGAMLLPHAREMARLLESNRRRSRSRSARRRPPRGRPLQRRRPGQGAVQLSSPHPDGRAFRFKGGGVGIATSGSGDVLAGIVGGLAARGADPLTALLWGVYLHGEAGRQLSKEIGRIGFLARELLDQVPGLLESDLEPLPLGEGAGGGGVVGVPARRWCPHRPHPNPSPEGEGLFG